MSFKVNDQVRILPFAYNITDTRVGMKAIVTRVDDRSTLLPVRVEYPDGNYNWTNYESLFLIEAAPNQNEAVGKDILDRMQELKASIVARDNAVKLVVEQTEALDALLAQYGLKRGEEISPIPVRVTATTRTVLDDIADRSIKIGNRYKCTSNAVDFFTSGETYCVGDLDLRDLDNPVAFKDDDDDEVYPDRPELAFFIRVI
jgi:hypothetical protein